MRIVYFILLLFAGTSAFTQEVVTGLQFNPVIVEKIREMNSQSIKSLSGDTIPVQLPFFDDFSSSEIFPSATRWIDQYTYVNTDFPLYPVNYGAVTFDAINDSGKIYSNGVPGPLTFLADRLTSRFIRLDSITTPVPRILHLSDSIYLSFYYQPQGRGRAPSTSDSLVLQFLVKPAHDSISNDTVYHFPDVWQQVWSSPGMSLDTFYIHNNIYFKRVMIPIVDTATYFKKYFKFRFYNLVSLASNSQPSWQSNCDEWNIDNVYLNSGRSKGDTIHREIRFLERAPSMLKRYTSMPYPQYSTDPLGEISDTITVLLSNRGVVADTASYSYYVTDLNSSFNRTYNSIPFIIQPYFEYSSGHALYPPVSFNFPIGDTDSSAYLMKHVVRDLTPGSIFGDTITGYQRFYNYFAYDDGTPEAGYGLNGIGAQMAYQFKLNKSPDTLRAIRIYFNHTLGHNNQQFFYLTVWNDNNGKPGDTIYHRIAYVNYTDSLNKFSTYHLENPVRISGTFYVGTEQTTIDNLNIGFDLYRNSEEFMFFNVAGTWLASTQGGTLLMRPVIGKPIPLGIPSLLAEQGKLSIYPNPARNGWVHVILPDAQKSGNDKINRVFVIHDLTGRNILNGIYSETIDISSLTEGIYLLEVYSPTENHRYTGKLVILH
jgi:hypothetical protein